MGTNYHKVVHIKLVLSITALIDNTTGLAPAADPTTYVSVYESRRLWLCVASPAYRELPCKAVRLYGFR